MPHYAVYKSVAVWLAIGLTIAAMREAGPAHLPHDHAVDYWDDFRDRRDVSASGRFYVVLQAKGLDGVGFEFCERARGAEPMTAAMVESSSMRPRGPKIDVSRDPVDRLLSTGTLPWQPYDVLVPDSGDGFLMFEKYGGIGRGNSVAWIDAAGAVRFAHALGELFPGGVVEATGGCTTISSFWWQRAWWLDESAATVVVVAVNGAVREVAIADGAVSTPTLQRLCAWVRDGDSQARQTAMELIAEGEVDGCRRAMALVAGTFHDRSQPLPLRLRAARILQRAGADEGVVELFVAATRQGTASPARCYAVRQLPAVMGGAAMPLLRDLMRGPASEVWPDSYQAFVALGEAAVPTLCEMLAEQGQSADYRGGAAHALRAIGGGVAIAALRAAADDPDPYVAQATGYARERAQTEPGR